MTTPEPLSPAAQAVMDAYHAAPVVGVYMKEGDQLGVAAALRAVADQVAPESLEPNRTINEPPERDVVFIGAWHIWNTQRTLRSKLHAIATELEGHHV
jgi:hypothetical protein